MYKQNKFQGKFSRLGQGNELKYQNLKLKLEGNGYS